MTADAIALPDFTGWDAEDALRELARLHLIESAWSLEVARPDLAGYVLTQTPLPGSICRRGNTVRLRIGRHGAHSEPPPKAAKNDPPPEPAENPPDLPDPWSGYPDPSTDASAVAGLGYAPPRPSNSRNEARQLLVLPDGRKGRRAVRRLGKLKAPLVVVTADHDLDFHLMTARAQVGKVHCWRSDGDPSNHLPILGSCRRFDNADDLANQLADLYLNDCVASTGMDSTFWVSEAQTLASGLLFAAAWHPRGTPALAVNWATAFDTESPKSLLKNLAEAYPDKPDLQYAARTAHNRIDCIAALGDRQLAGVIRTAAVLLQPVLGDFFSRSHPEPRHPDKNALNLDDLVGSASDSLLVSLPAFPTTQYQRAVILLLRKTALASPLVGRVLVALDRATIPPRITDWAERELPRTFQARRLPKFPRKPIPSDHIAPEPHGPLLLTAGTRPLPADHSSHV